MDALQKVVWAEGVFLGQQHFQLLDRYAETAQSIWARAASPFLFGLLSLGISREALKSGQFRLDSCRVIFPDGRLVGYDASERAPLTLDLASGTADRVEVLLGMPANQSVAGISGYQDRGRLCAWHADYHEVADLHDPSRTREVLVGRPNLVLLRGDEPREQFVTLKLAELVRQGDGGYVLVEDFIPSVCHVGASAALRALVQRVVDQLTAKVRILNERRARFGAVADFGPTELGQFLLLSALNPALAMLQHIQAHPDLHPQLLYVELIRLLSTLTPFRAEGQSEAWTPYIPGDLTTTFQRLEAQLKALLGEILPSRMGGLKLERESDALYTASGIDTRTLDRSSLFLAVFYDSDEPAWVTDFARQVKAGAREDIELIISAALGGVRLVHTQRPPNRLPVKNGYEYFRIEPKGEFWPRVREHQSLAVFLPGKLSAAKIELLSIDE